MLLKEDITTRNDSIKLAMKMYVKFQTRMTGSAYHDPLPILPIQEVDVW